jgi:hypothetical protein
MSRDPGNDTASADTVTDYLLDNYTEPDGTPLTRSRAAQVITEHGEYLRAGARLHSFASYVGDKIADDAGLTALPDDDPDTD